MSTPAAETATVETTTPGQEPGTTVETPPTDAPTDESGDEGDGNDAELPEWARKKLTKANSEAARFRTELRETQAKYKDAKTPEEFAAVTAEAEQRAVKLELELARTKAASKHKLSDEAAEFILGTTPEEIEASAKKLQALFGSTPPARQTVPGGGLDPNEERPETDPKKLRLAKRY